ncbi:MAG: hypothetical protein NC926_08230 [Candidatus Omnitrophica bacterium]|nr:hypothetical protein [Candidatus Omnitrophota bacterium]
MLVQVVKILFVLYLNSYKIEKWISFYPQFGKEPVNKAEVKIEISNKNILIFFNITSTKIVLKNLERDKRIEDEDEFCVVIKFGKNSDRGFLFGVNPLNTQFDAKIYNLNKLEIIWDSKWLSKTFLYDTLWEGEIKLPIEIFKELIDTSLYMNILWKAHTKENIEIASYAPIPEGFKEYDLRFLEKIPLRIEFPEKDISSIFPYIAFLKENKYFTKFGTDFKFKNLLNIQFTINPEYASIESDVDEFNLEKRRMVYLPEKRPFFLESIETWRMPFEAFYTRRISDIYAGSKFNLNLEKLNINGLWILEKDTLENKLEFKNSTYALRNYYNFNKFGCGIFYIKRKLKEEGMGIDFNFYFPKGFSLSSQYTQTKGEDIILNLERLSVKGFWINSGFEYIDSLFNLSTAYIPYYKNTFSFWLYGGYTWSYKRRLFPSYSLSIGGTDSYFLNKKSFERYGSITFFFMPFSEIEFSASLEPGKRFYEGYYYKNMIYIFSGKFGKNFPHSIEFSTQFGPYYGDYLNYFSLNYELLIFKKIKGEINYAISEIDEEEDKRILFRFTYHPLKKIFFKVFFQKSTISNRKDINFLFQYEFFAGSNLYLVYNHKNLKGEIKNIFMTKLSYEFNF